MKKLFGSISDDDKSQAIEKLIHGSSPRPDFFLMVVLSVLAASFGLFLNSASIIIGSMLIAPILLPVLSIAMGLAMSDFKLMNRSLITTAKSIALAIASAMVATFFFFDGKIDEGSILNNALLSSNDPILYFLVAVVAGITVAFAIVKPDLNALLPGAAVAVTIIPPLAATGIGLATFNGALVKQAGVLFSLNLFGIVVSSLIIFSMMNLYVKRRFAEKAVAKEEKADK